MVQQDRNRTVQIALVGALLLVGGLVALSLWVKVGDGTMGLVGALVGVVLTSAVTYTNDWFRSDDRLRTARMCVANDLRHWLTAVLNNVYDVRNFESSDSNAGRLHSTLPSLRFEADLGHIAVLDTPTSQKLFELVHAKDSANTEVDATGDFVGDEEAVALFRARSAELFLTGLEVYKDMCAKVGWNSDPFSYDSENMMQGEIEAHRKNEIERAEWNKKM